MPYDLDLEQRLDRFAAQLGATTKKRMFGGVAYLLNGNMAFGIHKQSLVIRTSPECAEKLLKRDNVSLFDITGKPMKGWLLVAPGEFGSDKQISDLLDMAVNYVKGLPSK
ncbi:MAG: TfoX/Sxy family protein [Chloroflexi bacterium]|nr:TfoX/Sxy family protein [Chloroflexota bacterium]